MAEFGDSGETGDAGGVKKPDIRHTLEATYPVARAIHKSIELEESSKDPKAWVLRQVTVKESVTVGVSESITYTIEPPSDFRDAKGIAMVYVKIGDRERDASIKFLELAQNENPYRDLSSNSGLIDPSNDKKRNAEFLKDIAEMYGGITKHGIKKEQNDFTVKRPDTAALTPRFKNFLETLPFTKELSQSPQEQIDLQQQKAQEEIDSRVPVPSKYSSPEFTTPRLPEGFFSNSKRDSFATELARRMEAKHYGVRVVDETYDTDGEVLEDDVALCTGEGPGGPQLLRQINDTPEAKVLAKIKTALLPDAPKHEGEAFSRYLRVMPLGIPSLLDQSSWPDNIKQRITLTIERGQVWAAADAHKYLSQDPHGPEDEDVAELAKGMALQIEKSAGGLSAEGVEPLTLKEVDQLIDDLIEREKKNYEEKKEY